MVQLRRAITFATVICGLNAGADSWAGEPAFQPILRLETGMHTATISRVATDAAGRWAVTASEDKTARVWEVATARQVAVLRPPQDAGKVGKLLAAAMSPDGTLVAVAGWTTLNVPGENAIYLFDRASARLVNRIGPLPNVIVHLIYSPDGRWLAAGLLEPGIRLFDAATGAERGRDAPYGGDCYSVHFSSDSKRLVSTSWDGYVRVYAVDEQGAVHLIKASKPEGGDEPYAARFSPDDKRIAVGFSDTTVVQVLDAESLAEVARPTTAGVNNGNLARVAWSADGRSLLAGGRWGEASTTWTRRWPVDDWSRYQDVLVSGDNLLDLTPLPAAAGGGWLFAAADPSWGVLDAEAQVRRRQDATIADLRHQRSELQTSADGRLVRFGYRYGGEEPHIFDLAARSLQAEGTGASGSRLQAASTSAPGLEITEWKNAMDPKLNGKPLKLKASETSRSLAIAPNGERFVLGTEWYLRLFDSTGKQSWQHSAPGVAWAVDISADGRFVVAAYADGTIRWHGLDNGREILAFFPHADRKRWVAWTPEGFFDASPGAEELIGYHLNRGWDREGEFVSAAQLREKFYQPGLIARRLDPDGDRLMADAVRGLGDVRELLAGASGRVALVELLSEANVTAEEEVTVRVKTRNQGGGVGEVVFYVDGQPQTGRQAGLLADATASRTFSLPPGRRRIEVAARNSAGVEGPRQVVLATITGPVRDAALHILAVGIEHYKSSNLQLANSVADAQAVAAEIAMRAKPLFQRGVSKPIVLTDSDATLTGIEKAFAELKSRFKPQDTLVIFLAGHGQAPVGNGYTFLPWEFERGAAGPAAEGLDEARLRGLLAQSPSQTILLLDTCDAGGAVSMLSSAYERLNGVTHQVVIGAARQGEFAKEGFEGHGVFTAALLHVMQAKAEDPAEVALNVIELRSDVDKEVRRILRRMGSASGQQVDGFLGNAHFDLVMRSLN